MQLKLTIIKLDNGIIIFISLLEWAKLIEGRETTVGDNICSRKGGLDVEEKVTLLLLCLYKNILNNLFPVNILQMLGVY